MADKGFNVQDLFAPYDVTINIPTFFGNKPVGLNIYQMWFKIIINL
jgi:hypothetical protein